jgi:hypothetical protein
MPHGNMTLIISCMIVACAYGQWMKNIVNSNIYFNHCLCDDIIMTSTFATNVTHNLFNTTISHFRCKCHLQLKLSHKLKLKICKKKKVLGRLISKGVGM